MAVAQAHNPDFNRAEKRVIFASSLGTVFEWYDFYLYAVLAPFFAALFFPPGNQTAALLSRSVDPSPFWMLSSMPTSLANFVAYQVSIVRSSLRAFG